MARLESASDPVTLGSAILEKYSVSRDWSRFSRYPPYPTQTQASETCPSLAQSVTLHPEGHLKMLTLRSGMVQGRSKLQWQLLEEATWRSGSGSRRHLGKGLKAWLDKMQIPGKCDLLFSALNSGALLVSPPTSACRQKS
jgi:hypothetical protein